MQIIVLHPRAPRVFRFQLTRARGVLLGAALCALVALVSSGLTWLVARHAPAPDVARQARDNAYLRENLTVMARHLGELQAQMVRLDALGERVSGLAGIDPQDFDFPDVLQRLFLTDAFKKAQADRDAAKAEFGLKNIHQKPEVFKMDILRTREDRVLVKVEGQLIRTGIFENQTFTESPKFTLNLTFARNPDMLANKRYPLGVWSYDYSIQ